MAGGNNMRGPISYMARNHVASNIIMLILVIGGLVIGKQIKQEVFPEISLDMIAISVVYPGATPAEIEDAILRPIELAVSGVDNVKHIRATGNENIGSVVIEVIEGADPELVLQDVKAEVDRITTFPEYAEKPIISKLTTKRQVISVMVYGDASERSLREHAERVKDDLLLDPDITQVVIAGARPYEISIEIPQSKLRSYNLTLDRVSQIIKASSLDLAGGSIRDEGGEVLIRTTEKRYTGVEFDSINVFTKPSGEIVYLGDIAEVKDSFQELDQSTTFDGEDSMIIQVFRVGKQTPKKVAKAVKAYVEKRNQELPPSIHLATYMDFSELLESRMNLLFKNGTIGLILVLIILSMFLELRLAMWVSMGIVISFAGALMFLPALDVSINMISLFGFLIILGIVVDDAIVVGENIFVHRRMGKSFQQASIDGAKEMARPVTFAVLTTVAAFAPLLFIGGFAGKFMGVIPKIVIVILLLSLVESLYILPSHLAGKMAGKVSPFWQRIEKRRKKFDDFLKWMIEKPYSTALSWSAKNRYATMAIAIALLLVTFGVFAGGKMKFIFMPKIDADEITVSLQMPPGTPYEVTKEHALKIQKIGERLIHETDSDRNDGGSNLKHTLVLLGQKVEASGGHGSSSSSSSNLAQIYLILDDPEIRTLNTNAFAAKWRKAVGEIPGAEQLTFKSDLVRGGGDLELQLSHTNFDELLVATEKLKNAMASYNGTSEILDSQSGGKREFKFKLRPEASSLGITEMELARQIRSAFYGSEALRIQRGQNEVKVMVRYPEEDRRTLATIDDMLIRTATGKEVPLKLAANVEDGRGFSSISRTDRRRVVNVSCAVDNKVANASEILEDLKLNVIPQLEADYPGLSYDLDGQSNNMRESMESAGRAMLFGLLLIYALLAIPFRSFSQPLVVMSAIPFGIVGATIGHMIMGYNISFISLWGIIALSGVVVNDSLVMIDFINRSREAGESLIDAVMISGKRRFRPIILTSLTTFFGLMPMIMETSIQAKFLIPMAIGLGFGVIFATGITLILIPTLYLVLEDVLAFFKGGEVKRERMAGTEAQEVKLNGYLTQGEN